MGDTNARGFRHCTQLNDSFLERRQRLQEWTALVTVTGASKSTTTVSWVALGIGNDALLPAAVDGCSVVTLNRCVVVAVEFQRLVAPLADPLTLALRELPCVPCR